MENTNFDILDATPEDLLIFEGFKPINAGHARLALGIEIDKDKSNRPAVRIKLKLVEMIAPADPTEEMVEPGHETTIFYSLFTKDGKPNQMGQGQLRELVEVLRPVFGQEGSTNREILEASQGAEITAVLKVRTNKDDPDQKSNTIKSGSIQIAQ